MNNQTNKQNLDNANQKSDFYRRLNTNEKQFNIAKAWYHSAMQNSNQNKILRLDR
ncbi:MAG TPA: hypothetical protein QF725_01285 [Gammaproteobacteria bacterium]|jgi:hypothetical protein|nr:hypothetical protein [Gammaproteobacteria bacterium]